ncbi:MAG: HDOD domain-containing protein [Candidatus Contendobacter sp.]|jgi:EAL and modified HD-GYP domain-containing signal transduction protein|nr:HDOD domain-containing protein [Gammaproteobacteria bacterium]MCC8992936.1 HDOD domain-containing protein [Candidatus Contendobacter sp.]
MLSRLFTFLFKCQLPHGHPAEQRDFQALNELAPVKGTGAAIEPLPPVQPGNRPDEAADRSVICREATLNREQRVAGYEFMLRQGIHDRVRVQSRRIHHIYNEAVINNLLQFSIHKLLGHRQAFITVLDSFLANPLIDQLPGQGMVLTVQAMDDDRDGLDPAVLGNRVDELRRWGFAFALEECFEGPHFALLAPHVNYFIVKAAQHSPTELKEIADRLIQQRNVALIARNLESFDDFELCRRLGFALFQGPFVTSHEDWTDNLAGPQTLRVCDLLNHLRCDAETAELAEIIKQDAILFYRLLRYINSAASGLRQNIISIEHALVLMGREKMYRWLTLLMFGSAQLSPHAVALQETALTRGRLMELVGAPLFAEAERDGLFVTGLFSMLDLVLQIPLPAALKPLHLPEAINAALLRNEGPYAPFLELALACESFDPDRIEAAAAHCGVELSEVNARHFETLAWVQAIQV